MRIVKLFGCRHSSTKYLTELLELNWNVSVATDKYGHKHGVSDKVPTNVPVIVVSKHPAAYIASVRDRHWGSKASTKVLIEEWAKNHSAWLELAEKQGIMIRYDDLLFDFENTMKKIGNMLKMISKHSKYQNVVKYCGNPKREVKRKYYKNGEYVKLMTPDDQESIDSIPEELLKKLGYVSGDKND